MTAQVATERYEASLPVVAAPGFVGRERDLSALVQTLADPPSVVIVEGEAGIGKSRLLREYLASEQGQDRRTLMTFCPPFRQPQTLGPVADALGQAGAEIRGLQLGPLAGALRPLFPEWSDILPPELEPAGDATVTRNRLFRALADLLAALSVAVLVVEDAHWADEATVEFLLFLASRQPPPVSLIVTWRPEDVPAESLLRRLSRLGGGAKKGLRITLGPLGVSAVAGLISSMLGGERVSPEFAAFVHQHSDGVALAVEESVRLMADRGDVFRSGSGWMRRRMSAIAVPPSIRDAVLERAGRLSRDAQAVLRAAAVLTEPATEAIVAAVAEIPPERARAGLSAGIESGLLAEERGGLLSFRHMLACRAVYEAIPAPHRRAIHHRAGTALEGMSPPPTASLARHFREAGETAAWCRYAEQATDMALASGDESTAVGLLHELLTQSGLSATSVARLAGKIPYAALTGRARISELAQALRSVLDASILDPAGQAEVRVQLGRVLEVMGEQDASRAQLELAIPHLTHDPAEATRAMMLLAWPHGTSSPVSRHRRWLRSADRAGASLGPADRLRLLVDRSTALLMLGDEAGWAEATRIPDDAPTAQQRHQITRGHMNIGDMAMMWGRYPEAGCQLAEALDLATRHQYPRYRGTILVNQAYLAWFTGAWRGLAEKASALAGNEDIAPASRAEAVLVTALLQAAAGAQADAQEHLGLALTVMRRSGFLCQCMGPAAALARLGLAAGRIDDALQVTEEPIRIVAGKRIWVWAADLAPARVDALATAGRIAEAEELVKAFAGGLRGRDAPAPKAGLALCRAIVAEGRGDQPRAAALYARAADAWQALPRPYDALLARERQARCQLAAGDHDAGLALLTQAEAGLSELGATADADRGASILRKHGVMAPRVWRGGRRGYGNQFSPRELEVVRLVTAGRTNREIARELCRSPATVASQLASAMRKQGVSSRTALAVAAAEAGIAPGGELQDADERSH